MSRTGTLVIAMHALPENVMPYYLSYLMSLGRTLMTLFILGPPKAQKKQDPMWKTAAMVVFRSGLLCMAVYAPRDRCKADAGDLHGRAYQVGADFSLHRSHRHKSKFCQCVGKRRYSGSLLLSEGVDGSARGSRWRKCSPTWLSRDSFSETPSRLL